MIGNEELKHLKELQKIHADPGERERHHKKVGFLCRLLGLIMLILAICINHYETLSSFECLIISFTAGGCVAMGYYFMACSKGVSLLEKYADIREELVCEKIKEIEKNNSMS